MAISIIQQPATIAFSRNPNWWGFKTDNLYSNAGTVSTYLLSFPGGALLDGDVFGLTYNGILQSFKVADVPDDSGLQVRSAPGAMTLADWCAWFAEDLNANFLLSRDFVIEVDLTGVDARVRLTARVADPIYDLELDAGTAAINMTLLANGVKKAKQPNFVIWMQLLVSNADNTGFEVVQTDTFLDVNDDGECFPNLSKTLTESLIGVDNDFEQPDPALPVVQRNRKSCRRYYIRYAEAYGSKQSIRKVKDTDVKWVMLGGTGKATHDNYSIADSFLVGGFQLFLTPPFDSAQGDVKTVTIGQAEWLSLVWLNAAAATVKVKVKTYFTVGDPVEHDAFTVADVAQYDKITFPAGPTQLNLPGLYLDKTVAYYEVWLADGADVRVSEVRTYQIDYKYEPFTNWFSCLSSLGSYDGFRTIGKGSTEYELLTQQATLTKTNTFKFEQGETLEFDASISHKQTVLSGFLTKRELKRYRDFFLSWNKFQIRQNRAYPVMVNSKSIKEYQDGENLYFIEFEIGYRFTEETWTEEDEDLSAGVPVDVSAFWPAVSNPDPVNFDHLYYRKAETYNKAEVDTFINNALTTEANHHATQSGQIDALNTALAGKSDVGHNHEGTYVTVGEYNDFVVKVGAALLYKGAWVAGYSVDPTDPEVVLGYAVDDVVDYAGTLWRSLVADNEEEPGLDAVSWVKIIEPRTVLDVADSTPVVLDWQNALIPGKDYTWAQKHGNAGVCVEGLFVDGAVERSYKPTVTVTRAGGLITQVEFGDVFQGKILIV